MKRKKLPNQKQKGLYIYCTNNSCKKYFSWTNRNVKNDDGTFTKTEPLCGVSDKKISACKSIDKHKFIARLFIPGTIDKRVRKTLTAENYAEAVQQTIDYQNEFNQSMKYTDIEAHNKRLYLFDCQIKYLNFLENVGVPEHKKVERSKKHIKDILKNLTLFNEALVKNKINKKIFLIDRINDDHVGYFHSYLLNNKGYFNKTYNNKMSSLKGFFKWAIKEFKLNMQNPFEDVKSRASNINKDTITKSEFLSLLDIISPDNGKVETGKTNKKSRNRYKLYLKDGLELALHTGGRREEIVEIRWNMIHETEGIPVFIEVKNLKVERQKGEGFNTNVAPKIIPITKSLKKLLYRMGYENKKNSHEYLISPDRIGTSTSTIMDNLSKGFSHYYKQLDTDRHLQFKSLRKTYLTYLNSTLSNDTKSLSSHTTNDVLQKHYIDERVVSKAIKELNIFDV